MEYRMVSWCKGLFLLMKWEPDGEIAGSGFIVAIVTSNRIHAVKQWREFAASSYQSNTAGLLATLKALGNSVRVDMHTDGGQH